MPATFMRQIRLGLSTMHPETYLVLQQLVSLLPDFGVLSRIRVRFYRRCLSASGDFSAASLVRIRCPQHVSIGEGTSLNTGVLIDACNGGRIEIGRNVAIGPFCVIRSADHGFSDTAVPILAQAHVPGPISVEDDCWIGSHVTVTRGVRIGHGSVVGANSVVTRDIPPYSIAVGVPARVVRSRRSERGLT